MRCLDQCLAHRKLSVSVTIWFDCFIPPLPKPLYSHLPGAFNTLAAFSLTTALGRQNCYFLHFTDFQMRRGVLCVNHLIRVIIHLTDKVGIQTLFACRAHSFSVSLFLLHMCCPGFEQVLGLYWPQSQSHVTSALAELLVSSYGAPGCRFSALLILQRTHFCLLHGWCQCFRKWGKQFLSLTLPWSPLLSDDTPSPMCHGHSL